jgi:hypothetical protein
MLRKPAAGSAEDGEKWLADVSVCIGDAGLSATDKLNLKRIVTAYGGTVSYLVHPKVPHTADISIFFFFSGQLRAAIFITILSFI